MKEKAIITAAVTGAFTPRDIVDEAVPSCEEGAAVCHVHS